MNSQTHSPLPSKKKEETLITFIEAIAEMIGGKKISRKLWDDPEEYCLVKDFWFMIHTKKEVKSGSFHKWLISDGDYKAEDWFVIE